MAITCGCSGARKARCWDVRSSRCEEKLDPRRFFRANRRQIVNLDYIESVEMGLGGRLHVQLRDGPEIEISRRQARQFRARMSVDMSLP